MSDARATVIEDFGRKFESLGLPYNLGRIYGIALVAEQPLSQDDLAEELHVSQSVVSTNCRALVSMGMLRKVRVKGDRRTLYEMPADIVSMIAETAHRRIATLRGLMDEAASLGLDGAPARRVDTMRRWMDIVEREVNAAVIKALKESET